MVCTKWLYQNSERFSSNSSIFWLKKIKIFCYLMNICHYFGTAIWYIPLEHGATLWYVSLVQGTVLGVGVAHCSKSLHARAWLRGNIGLAHVGCAGQNTTRSCPCCVRGVGVCADKQAYTHTHTSHTYTRKPMDGVLPRPGRESASQC